MWKSLRPCAVILLLAAAAGGCDNIGSPPPKIQGTSVDARPGSKSPPPSNAAARLDERIIVALGDSLTAGLGVTPGDSYPSQLQEKLVLAGYRYRIINAGVSGDTTAGAVRRLDWVLKSKPEIVIIELGANDGLRGLDLKETRANLEQIIQRVLAADAKVVLAGMKLPPNYGPEYSRAFQNLYTDIAKRYNVAVFPFFLEGVATKTNLNQADGIHPTGKGYTVVVNNLWPIVEPLLKK